VTPARRLLRLTRGARGRLALAAAIALLVLAANVALLTVAGWFIAAMAAAGLAGVTMNYFTPAAAIRAFAITRTVGRYLERLVGHDAVLRLLTKLRGRIYRRLEPLAPAGLERYRRGDLLSRLVGDVDTLDNAYLQVAIPVAAALCATLGALGFLAAAAPVLIPVELGLLAVTGVALPAAARALGRKPGNAAAQTSGDLKAEVLDSVRGLAELEVLGAADASREAVLRLDSRLTAAQRSGHRIDAGALALSAGATGLAVWLAFVILEPGTAAGRTDPLLLPMLVFFTLASGEIVQGLPGAFRALEHTLAAARRIFEATDTPPAVTEPVRPASLPERYDLHFEHVSMHYPRQPVPALSGLDLALPEGGSLAIVGPSGAGKSSIAQLLLRFRDYDGGDIRLGERSLGDCAGDDVRSRIAWVSQDSRLFSTTLRENLRLARPDADDDDLWVALTTARVADEVAALPDGLDTFVGTGGIRLSTGQTRRVMLARALLKDAPILLLDEPTEGLDPINERALVRALTESRGPRSLLLITHRLAGLDAIDEIAVLDAGRVVQRGRHHDLIERPGPYRTMAAYFTG